MIGLVEVAELSERSKKHGRGCHMAMDVPQEDLTPWSRWSNGMAAEAKGDRRADDGLRPEGERSIYLFDPDNNRLQITAHAPNQKEQLLDDEEKWARRIIAAPEGTKASGLEQMGKRRGKTLSKNRALAAQSR